MIENKQSSPELTYVGFLGEEYKVVPKLNMYANNNNLYVGLDYYDSEYECWVPFCDITVNVQNLPFLESAIDTNNNGAGVLKFLLDNGFGVLTDKVQFSGYCAFPVFCFNKEKLKEIDPEMFAEYEKAAGHRGLGRKSLDASIEAAKRETHSSSDAKVSVKDDRSFDSAR